MLYRTDKDGNPIKIAGNSNLAYQGNSLPIGSIFTSALPQTSNKYHLLNGDCLEVNGIYNGFFNYLISLVSQGYSVTCTANEYAEDLYKVGSCGRFVLNNTSNEVVGSYTNEEEIVVEFTIPAHSFKLPTITTFIQGVNSLEELGKAIEAGLPNITGTTQTHGDSGTTTPFGVNNSTGAFYNDIGTPYIGGNYGAYNFITDDTIRLDASLSNSIYGNSDTVQPPSIKYLYYIVLISGSALNIKANPELTGDEEVLKSINIGGQNYLLGGEGSSLDSLWENPNPSEAFEAQTLEIPNIMEYDFILLQSNSIWKTNTEGGSSVIIPTSTVKKINNTYYLSNGCFIAKTNTNTYYTSRNFYVTENSVVFSYGKQDGSTNNECCVPNFIYGIKLGSSSSQQFKPQVYSTEETPIGVWIDGKTIYRKVVEVGDISSGNTVVTISDNIKRYIHLSGSSEEVPLPILHTRSLANCVGLYIEPEMAVRIMAGSDAGASNVYLIAEYTKNN